MDGAELRGARSRRSAVPFAAVLRAQTDLVGEAYPEGWAVLKFLG